MVQFRAMTADEFATFKAWLIDDYAGDIARNYQLAYEDARRSSEQQISALLPDGPATTNHLLFSLLVEASDQVVGHLWCYVEPEQERAFVYDIIVHEPHRRKGYGSSALTQLEHLLVARGVRRLGLHVFGDNYRAQALYQRLGYRVTDLSMQKELPPGAVEVRKP